MPDDFRNRYQDAEVESPTDLFTEVTRRSALRTSP
jgi:hypothetical protein